MSIRDMALEAQEARRMAVSLAALLLSTVVLEVLGSGKPPGSAQCEQELAHPYFMRLTGTYRSNFVLGDIRKAPRAIYLQVTCGAP